MAPPKCAPCVPLSDKPADSSLRDAALASTMLSPYGVALKKKDEEDGLFIHTDCYLFAGDPDQKWQTLIGKYWMPSSFVTLGIGNMVLTRWLSNVPIRAKGSIWKMPLVAVVGWVGGLKCRDYLRDYTAERDAHMLHYCRLHPKDFPREKRVQYKDYLTYWFPIR
ncbi:uncharacterized protein LOC110849510 [Folsomia candida]|uniref:NADH dehydrogenase [ubiquinone] 1 subunit C2 n=1 Tax=Folsomia candida TaxID=158441 RepID=A0A226EET7_FOLCA|nr:uncharacterized protein LOC110849510 [Folsomia candida]XP_035706534.1 uncharacterized protein LOC110849510 [Folsomia candida]OXA55341.1 NADH dehydrogenase [ubiquinone] 1 subunit C2 [Folsomia candida]